MSFRAASLALLALLVAFVVPAALAGCGRSSLFAGETTIIGPDAALLDSSTCGPSTCNGCCLGSTCTAGTALQACGGGGAACSDCAVSVQTGTGVCDAKPTGGGECAVVPPVCDCPDGGACDESGKCAGPCGDCAGCCVGIACLAGTAGIECGTGGNECQACADGAHCLDLPQGGGACVSNLCNPDNCAGCCSPTGCQPGTLLSACGTLGQACEACTGSQCAPAGPNNGGVCVATGCNPQNCPGCCDTNGLCQSGTGISACGAAGDLCQICSLAEVCVAGSCATPQECGPQTCAGCCEGSTCTGGGAGDACGSGGGACQDCGDTAACVANVCQTLGPCDQSSCPDGCCQGNLCLPGTNDSACGSSGSVCTPCGPGTQCAGGSCQMGATCGPSNCSGCCSGDECIGGTSASACGLNGSACQGCGASAECVNGTCVATCGPVTCTGCCQGSVCGLGGQSTACGTEGAACQNCMATGATCESGACVAQPCGPGTCDGCCSATGNCAGGASASACGVGGEVCSDCTSIGDVCSAGACVATPPMCSPANCPFGCCDTSGVCQDGFLSDQCGSGGIACLNCTASGTTCDVNATPRACTSAQTTCPASYAGCPNGTTTQAPIPQPGACTAQDLAEAQAACAGGADTTGCSAFLQTLTSNGAQACALCLQPFVVPFAQVTGIALCAAPYVPASCNQATGCYTNCETATCGQCPSSQLAACQAQVASGSCSTYATGLLCLQAAENGAGAFCNPQSYSDFGAWLEGVGGQYCE